jgi:hypothetical protein
MCRFSYSLGERDLMTDFAGGLLLTLNYQITIKICAQRGFALVSAKFHAILKLPYSACT